MALHDYSSLDTDSIRLIEIDPAKLGEAGRWIL
jgi:hypothetical protein